MLVSHLDSSLWRLLAASPYDRVSTGRRVLVLLALVYLLNESGRRDVWPDIRNKAAHSPDPEALRRTLLNASEQVEAAWPQVAGSFAAPLMEDVLHSGGALPQHIIIAHSIAEAWPSSFDHSFADWFDMALDEVVQGRDAGEIATSRPLAKLMVGLAQIDAGCSVLDPATGIGTILSSAAGTGAALFGQEINSVAWAMARLRLFLLRADAQIELGNSVSAPANFGLPEPPEFDRVICDPPGGTAREAIKAIGGRIEFASPRLETIFLQHSLASLKPDGRAVLLVSLGFLTRRGAEAKLRASLVQTGQLEGVIGLPSGVVAWSGTPFAILILRGRPLADRERYVTFIDATYLKDPGTPSGERLSDEKIEALIALYRQPDDAWSIRRASDSLSNAEENLLPSSYVKGAKMDRADLRALAAELKEQEAAAIKAATELDRLYTYLKLRF